ncbi:unnamed protein product [Rhizophagus irregularis]|nr:unnamed protein product [Rhizophagus irregularis]
MLTVFQSKTYRMDFRSTENRQKNLDMEYAKFYVEFCSSLKNDWEKMEISIRQQLATSRLAKKIFQENVCFRSFRQT